MKRKQESNIEIDCEFLLLVNEIPFCSIDYRNLDSFPCEGTCDNYIRRICNNYKQIEYCFNNERNRKLN